MRKQDLKVGQEYAIGSSSRYSRFSLVRARLVELDGQREVRRSYGGTQRKSGLIVSLVDTVTGYGEYRGEAGKELILDSARRFQAPWPEYAALKAAHDEQEAEKDAEVRRRRRVAEDAEIALRKASLCEGVRWNRGNGDFTVPADTMAKIVARLAPSPSVAKEV